MWGGLLLPLRHNEIILGNRCYYWRRLSGNCFCATASCYCARYAVRFYLVSVLLLNTFRQVLHSVSSSNDEESIPSGKKFRSKPQLARYLGSSMDLSTFDFRTGKMLMSKMNKNRQRMRYDCSNQAKGKPDLNTALPVRQTASIFKQPVTKITNHPSNKVKSDPQKAVDQPRQLFWEKKLSGLNAFDIAEELVKTMDLPKGLQGVGPGCTDETLLSAIASALHTSTMPITGQLSAAVEKNPGVWLNTSQPLCKAFMVTDEDIRKQEELVQQVRKRLEEALMADMLAHVEEIARDGEAPTEKEGGEEEGEDEEEEEEQDHDQEMENGVPPKNSQYKPYQQGQHNYLQSQECLQSKLHHQSSCNYEHFDVHFRKAKKLMVHSLLGSLEDGT
ncbi:UNVERIFIED_CONTAM: hypothetical protein H355_009080 [Colinus virginianus]|nr:hypothetical protein H355_009080 [Colinus virginianus]